MADTPRTRASRARGVAPDGSRARYPHTRHDTRDAGGGRVLRLVPLLRALPLLCQGFPGHVQVSRHRHRRCRDTGRTSDRGSEGVPACGTGADVAGGRRTTRLPAPEDRAAAAAVRAPGALRVVSGPRLCPRRGAGPGRRAVVGLRPGAPWHPGATGVGAAHSRRSGRASGTAAAPFRRSRSPRCGGADHRARGDRGRTGPRRRSPPAGSAGRRRSEGGATVAPCPWWRPPTGRAPTLTAPPVGCMVAPSPIGGGERAPGGGRPARGAGTDGGRRWDDARYRRR
jgi:hypothetical protein